MKLCPGLDFQLIDYQLKIFWSVIRARNGLVESGSVLISGFLYICI